MQNKNNRKKVLLMGRYSSGKTSMRSVIFSNFAARDTARLGPTMMVENAHVRFLNNLVLNLWDCGGQDRFYKCYFESQREHIFRGVELLVYVFDVKNIDEKDLDNYRECLDSIMELSPSAKVFVLIHKIDPKDGSVEVRRKTFQDVEQRILLRSNGIEVKCFATSIFDDTLVQSWSEIISALVPNSNHIQKMLRELLKSYDANEVVLFERATFLVVAHASRESTNAADVARFQKISSCMKGFRLSCGIAQNSFEALELRSENFSCYLDRFTESTFILIVLPKSKRLETTGLNLAKAKPLFENILTL